MGTLVSQRIYGIHATQCAALAAAEIARLSELWSVFSEDSETRALARSAGSQPIVVSDDTLCILRAAKAWRLRSQGAFDVTAAPLCSLWREAAAQGQLPAAAQIEARLELVNDADLLLDEVSARPAKGLHASAHADREPARPRAFLRRAGQAVDLGGIAKGYAADRCRELLAYHGVRHAALDLGGNVVLLGSKPDGSPWRVGIQDPARERGACVGYLEIEDCSVVTSAHYERYFELGARRYSHILDPRTGWPVDNDLASVTVVARSSMEADALATACCVLGLARSRTLLEETREMQALFIDRAGAMHLTPALVPRFFRASAPSERA